MFSILIRRLQLLPSLYVLYLHDLRLPKHGHARARSPQPWHGFREARRLEKRSSCQRLPARGTLIQRIPFTLPLLHMTHLDWKRRPERLRQVSQRGVGSQGSASAASPPLSSLAWFGSLQQAPCLRDGPRRSSPGFREQRRRMRRRRSGANRARNTQPAGRRSSLAAFWDASSNKREGLD
uniref:Uncharacterized protein n=1 Tax=Scleropages formosus TaxID=113540 RepID=A0A8C9TTY5_SCLFO